MPIKGQSPKQVVHTEMHKFKHGNLHSGSKHGPLVKSRKQAIAIALSESGQARKRGGSIRSRIRKYADGGELPDVGEPMIPSGGQFSPGVPAVNKAADIGSKIVGPMAADIGTAGPLRRFVTSTVDASKYAPGSEEAHEAYGDIGNATGELGMNMIGPKGAGEANTFGVFVGPYGAKALRESGYNKPHPAHAAEFKRDPAAMPPDLKDVAAQEFLNLAPNLSPRERTELFRQSGWSKGAEGANKLEIPDTGAKLVKNKEGEGYLLKHPAGDFHEIYGIPPIKFDPNVKVGEAYVKPRTNEIFIGGMPTQTNIKNSMPQVLHEVQHTIQKKENFAYGDHPDRLPQTSMSNPLTANKTKPNEFDQEYYPGQSMPSWQTQSVKDQIRRVGVDPDSAAGQRMLEKAISNDRNKMVMAKHEAYKRSAGETEARNVMDRFTNKSYKEYPEFTEDVGRGLQHIQRYGDIIKSPGYARGGEVDDMYDPTEGGQIPKSLQFSMKEPPSTWTRPPRQRYAEGGFNPEKAASIGLARKASTQPAGLNGLINSSIPGRTDKINANVPAGAYIIPADIVSGMGQGNTAAGGAILGKLMNRGPYNMNIAKTHSGSRIGNRHSSLRFNTKMPGFADGGETDTPTPIVAAGGEYVVHPEQVRALGAGDLDAGHNILDAFVKHQREQNIAKLRKLPGPKGAKT